MNKIDKIFERFNKANPHPNTELNYINNYTLLVAVVLSAQATDVSVNKATKDLFNIVQTPAKMLELGEEQLTNIIKSIGLYKTKARNVIKLSQILIEKFNSIVPSSLEELISLPGVGEKTARVILNTAFHIGTIAVDTHVHRVSNRLGIVHTNTPDQTSKIIENAIPKKWHLNAHHWLILHGRYICKARKPLCEQCIEKDLCDYYKANYKTPNKVTIKALEYVMNNKNLNSYNSVEELLALPKKS